MNPYKIDLAVLCVFFARPDTFSQVFEQVRRARPSKLFLYQDGPREDRPDDVINIARCRAIVDNNIDWKCEVYRNYQEVNVGCDPSMFNAITWMFSMVDKGVILEDDIVASQSFFTFAKQMLDRYEEDNRIFNIAGMNHLDVYNDDYADYFFTRRSAIWGWATWKRCVNMYDMQYRFLDSDYAKRELSYQTEALREKMKTCKWHKSTGKAYFETILWNTKSTNHMLDIVPSKNLTSNIGIGVNGSHGAESLKTLPNGLKQVYYKKTYELEMPLRHPPFVIEDVTYTRKFCRILSEGYPMIKAWRGIQGGIKSFCYADKKGKIAKLKRLPRSIGNVLHIFR